MWKFVEIILTSRFVKDKIKVQTEKGGNVS